MRKLNNGLFNRLKQININNAFRNYSYYSYEDGIQIIQNTRKKVRKHRIFLIDNRY